MEFVQDYGRRWTKYRSRRGKVQTPASWLALTIIANVKLAWGGDKSALNLELSRLSVHGFW